MEWIDKIVEAQREQREILNRICSPFTAVELQEFVTEDVEITMTYNNGKYEVLK